VQVPPWDMPLMHSPDKRSHSYRSKPKVSDDQRKLDTAHALNQEQYNKQRYAVPREVHAANLRACGREGMADDGGHDGQAGETVLRLNFDAFALHFRHQHCVEFITSAQGSECSQVQRLSLRVCCARVRHLLFLLV
jgi:hypothetical protein